MGVRAASFACLLALTVAGCGTADREADAGAAAQRFHAALEQGDGRALGTFWLGTWLAQSISGVAAYNAEQLDHQQGPLSWWQYIGTASFWENTLENWQSEFLAVGSMAILAVYLRQRGSPESKPVGTPHGATGVEG